jgi:iron complex outermembrane receptor protein
MNDLSVGMAPSRLAPLLGTVSLFVLAQFSPAYAQGNPPAQQPAAAPVEDVLITGSLIRGAAAVGVPVTALNAEDLRETGAVTVSDLLKSVPAVQIRASNSSTSGGGNAERNSGVDIHSLAANTPRTLMLVDGMRFPLQNHNTNYYDPSLINTIALERVDVLADGASATYGSDAVAGVVNLILRRGYDGAITQALYGFAEGGAPKWQLAQLWGTGWDSGDITLSYEFYNEREFRGPGRDYITYDFTSWGLDNRTPITSSMPGTVSTGVPNVTTGNGCTNCYAVPAGQNGAGLTWANLIARQGTNQVNPYKFADLAASQQRSGATAVLRQDLTDTVQFFAEGFYSNRRTRYIYPATISSSTLFTQAVPTTNPFYPVGAPSGLRVSYNFNVEAPATMRASELSMRYAAGADVELPFEWNGRFFFATNEEKNKGYQRNLINRNNLNAAVGNTVPAAAAAGTVPGQAAFTKPANIPFLNLFCDPTAFTCNPSSVIDYISGFRNYDSHYILHQWSANLDGRLFDLPGGPVLAAVGGAYQRDNYIFTTTQNFNQASNAIINVAPDSNERKIWAAFGQLSVPIVGEDNAMPFVRRLDLELSYRYDHYNDFGGTKNPKIAFDWEPAEGLTIRGSWGTSFRAPAFGDISTVAGKQIQAVNTGAGAASNSLAACATIGGTPVPGSAAAVLNPTCSAALQFPAGITARGASGGSAGVTRPADYALKPEEARNYTVGFNYAPQYLPGLTIDVSYFNVFIKNALSNIETGIGGGLNDPLVRFAYILPGDPGFDAAVAALIQNPKSDISPAVQSNIRFINDGMTRNAGSLKLDGIDFDVGYSFELPAFGVWDLGVQGTYYLHRITITTPGAPPVDAYDNQGVTQAPPTGNGSGVTRVKYRARLGWTLDNLTLAGFVNYQSHYFSTEARPPASVLAAFPNYAPLVPAYYSFDLSAGYDLGDMPASPYLKNLAFQLVVNNITGRKPPFMYKVSNTGGTAAFDGSMFSPLERVVTFSVTKTW